ncbi:alkylhydroperoxidase domain protein [Nocardia rhizosphaerihabitans]|uniref:Alkyl hydroperoxide reductase AhpD n=1 Tax=Nocardia rhizosphaerihabitans TaxID=1691570 RepID=A0ABQ2K8E5_9NOCA|nr:alkylhydroperoxidase domain protein [Nocardia rhizosphaerihabitans]GGN72654.1 alkyl hydroperoxide reductase AhpD [Nocardia rhizosphaerihabitans]
MTEVRTVETARRPTGFTQDQLDWVPWVEPIALADADEQQRPLLEGRRGESPYFRLLARNAEVLAHRSANDKDIFYSREGLSRAERELAATVTSRYNGCEYCASVHSRFTSQLSKRASDVQRLLDDGVAVRIDERWDAIIDFTAALAARPPRSAHAELARLHLLGFDDADIHDLVLSTASFSWANRLMLSLGEPEVLGACVR